jgi:hypothetical protein
MVRQRPKNGHTSGGKGATPRPGFFVECLESVSLNLRLGF